MEIKCNIAIKRIIAEAYPFVFVETEASYSPFVTWRRDTVHPEYVGNGHYFTDFAAAQKDFAERVHNF